MGQVIGRLVCAVPAHSTGTARSACERDECATTNMTFLAAMAFVALFLQLL